MFSKVLFEIHEIPEVPYFFALPTWGLNCTVSMLLPFLYAKRAKKWTYSPIKSYKIFSLSLLLHFLNSHKYLPFKSAVCLQFPSNSVDYMKSKEQESLVNSLFIFHQNVMRFPKWFSAQVQ